MWLHDLWEKCRSRSNIAIPVHWPMELAITQQFKHCSEEGLGSLRVEAYGWRQKGLS